MPDQVRHDGEGQAVHDGIVSREPSLQKGGSFFDFFVFLR